MSLPTSPVERFPHSSCRDIDTPLREKSAPGSGSHPDRARPLSPPQTQWQWQRASDEQLHRPRRKRKSHDFKPPGSGSGAACSAYNIGRETSRRSPEAKETCPRQLRNPASKRLDDCLASCEGGARGESAKIDDSERNAVRDSGDGERNSPQQLTRKSGRDSSGLATPLEGPLAVPSEPVVLPTCQSANFGSEAAPGPPPGVDIVRQLSNYMVGLCRPRATSRSTEEHLSLSRVVTRGRDEYRGRTMKQRKENKRRRSKKHSDDEQAAITQAATRLAQKRAAEYGQK